MDWSDSPEQAAFRQQVKDFIQKELPERYRSGDESEELSGGWQADRKSDNAEHRDTAIAWADSLAKKGWIAPAWPKEYGGAGLTTIEQFIYNQEMAEVAAPMPGGMGVSMLGPTLIVHGTDEQKAQHLSGILSGDVQWAQGYSEPGSGSDLASLQTRAIRDGDDFVINGQKIWTSGAHLANMIFALVRTDPEAPKHRGITYLLFPMTTPGISVRPLVQMSDARGFNETFFEDVRVPVANRVGDENRGWYVGMTLLDYERSNITGAVSVRRDIESLLDYANGEGKTRSRLKEFNSIRLDVADRYIESEVMYNFSFRIISMQ
ncbi:MAG: acyl-CoA dehydrogenase family protein, partial [Dehalococcoidia bacterium]|nr:acyl-CoA dehydrogenase family protein [Dehalococcoidia bacterium]